MKKLLIFMALLTPLFTVEAGYCGRAFGALRSFGHNFQSSTCRSFGENKNIEIIAASFFAKFALAGAFSCQMLSKKYKDSLKKNIRMTSAGIATMGLWSILPNGRKPKFKTLGKVVCSFFK